MEQGTFVVRAEDYVYLADMVSVYLSELQGAGKCLLSNVLNTVSENVSSIFKLIT